jgi:hypothetical protein
MAVKIKFVASKRIINSVPALNSTPTLHCNDQPVNSAREISEHQFAIQWEDL